MFRNRRESDSTDGTRTRKRGQALVEIREATGDYRLPEDACPTFRALYQELVRMEGDLHQHIHLENNILFPRAIAAESPPPSAFVNLSGR